MVEKPDYEALENKIKRLEDEIVEYKKTEGALRKSLEIHKTVVGNIDVGLTIIGIDYKIIWVSPKICDWFGKNHTQFVGKRCYKMFEQKNSVCDYCPAVKAIATGQPNETETQGVKPDGTCFTVRDRVFPILKGGEVIAFNEIVEDITERKLAEEALRESEVKYRHLIEAASAAIFALNYDGRYLFMNELAAQQIGGRPDDFVGQTIWEVFPQEIADKYIFSIRYIISNGKDKVTERETILQGERRWYKTIGKPLADKTGSVYGAIFVGIDETERKLAEIRVGEYANELENMVEDRTKELKSKTTKLEEINIALKVLIREREKDKTTLQEQIVSNVQKLVIPYIDILKAKTQNDLQNSILDLINSNLLNITSSFSLSLSSDQFGLTRSEMLVANFIRQGRKTKEVSDIINISPKTVSVHRNNVRNKLGINGKKVNLQTYLRTHF